MKYQVTIEEHISQSFCVTANSMEEAMKLAEKNYKSGKFIVEPSTPTAVLMMAETSDGNESTEWTQL